MKGQISFMDITNKALKTAFCRLVIKGQLNTNGKSYFIVIEKIMAH